MNPKQPEIGTPGSTASEVEISVLLAMYNEQCDQARHYESQHLTILGFIVTVALAIGGLVLSDRRIDKLDVPLAAVVITVGLLGLLVSISYYSRSFRHGKRAEQLRKAFDARIPTLGLADLRKAGDLLSEERFQRYGIFRRVRIHRIWYALNVCISLVGLILLLSAVASAR